MVSIDVIAKALRCTETPGSKCDPDCPYYLLEQVSERIPVPPDVVIEGKPYWQSCDTYKICIDAADMLENISKVVKNEKS